MRKRTYFVVGFTMLLAMASLVAGPLTPPAGPVTSTNKTLQEVEPRTAINLTNTPGDADSLFKITQPGSYYLTGNITGLAGRHGIEIAASSVTLDLMGFDLVGSAEVAALDGVSATVLNLTNITIRNGSVRGWGGDGVDVGNSSNNLLDGLRASANNGNGIAIGTGSTISGCLAYNNTAIGIWAVAGSTVMGCTAYSNNGNGIVVGQGSTVTGCTAYLNGELFFTANGIRAGSGSTVTGCTAHSNTGDGIFASSGSTVTGCTAHSNTRDGISAGSGSTVAGCTARLNIGNGISASSSSTVTGCTATSNTGDGINVGISSTVTGCTARLNNGDGIQVDSDCRVTDNTCESNGFGAGNGAGIFATGGDNRIEGNHCTGADRGIDVDVAGNIIIKNTCAGNIINWVIAANNYYGPIINRTGVVTAAVNGAAAAGTLATTDPNANFSY